MVAREDSKVKGDICSSGGLEILKGKMHKTKGGGREWKTGRETEKQRYRHPLKLSWDKRSREVVLKLGHIMESPGSFKYKFLI